MNLNKMKLCFLALCGAVFFLNAGDHNELNLPNLPGCQNECNPKFVKMSHFTEKDGNKCIKLELSAFEQGKNRKSVVNGAVWLGNFVVTPNSNYDYELSVKGTISHVYLSALEWVGPERYKDLKFLPMLKYRKLSVKPEWSVYKGSFRTGAKTQKIALSVHVYEDRNFHKPEYKVGDYVLIDRIRIADQTGKNLFTHLTFLPAESSAVIPKKKNEYVILFKGNSITRHGFNEDTKRRLGWDHLSGMAASSEEKDYAHQLCAMIQSKLSEMKVRPVFGAGNKNTLSFLEREHEYRADLIVFQGGEHAATKEEFPLFEEYMRTTLKGLKAFPGNPKVIVVGIWTPSEYSGLIGDIQNVQRKVSAEFNVPFVSVETFAKDPACRGWGTSGGVKWHPNDLGMKKYAESIFEKWNAESKK